MNRYCQLIFSLAGILLIYLPLYATPLPWSVEIERIATGGNSLEQVTLGHFPGEGDPQQVDVSVRKITSEDSDIQPGPLLLTCPGSLDAVVSHLCEEGRWSIEVIDEFPALNGTIVDASFDESKTSLSTEGFVDEISWQAEFELSDSGFLLQIEIPEQPFENLRSIAGDIQELAWVSSGRFVGNVEVTGTQAGETWIRSNTELIGIDFDSPDGLYAGLGVNLNVSIGAGDLESEPVALNAQITSGELLLLDFYRDFSDSTLDMAAFLELAGPTIDINRFVVNDGSVLSIAGEAKIPFSVQPGENEQEIELILRELSLVFPQAYSGYLEPVATVYSLDGLDTSGSVSWAGDWTPGSARSGTLNITNLSIEDAERGRFGIRNFNGELSTFSESTFTWDTFVI